ncbi:hypothetical protein A3K73_02585 [Candidatus Pacearchaeota archaeon RBG_13_36_9]|nr:MAG: hypothetical protein A3K73_02585 [Candidatus Pacearchaeota archaeon RBG_13_36_9]
MNPDESANSDANLEASIMDSSAPAEENEKMAFKPVQKNKQPQISREEEIGIHKGALNTLLAERNELIKMVANVEVIMQAHISRLKELGVEIKVQQPKEEVQ